MNNVGIRSICRVSVQLLKHTVLFFVQCVQYIKALKGATDRREKGSWLADKKRRDRQKGKQTKRKTERESDSKRD